MGSKMSSKAKHYVAPAATREHARTAARRPQRRYERRREVPWLPVAAGLVLTLVVGIAAFIVFNGATAGRGVLTAPSTRYAFGDVPWQGGYVTTRFALTVDGDTTVNDIVST
jgi:hypothetical protein